MKNRMKNGIILFVLISFLCFIAIKPVTCIFNSVTGFSCPACGITRSFLAILHFDFISSFRYNILGIPLFVFIIVSLVFLIRDFILNCFSYISNLLIFFEKQYIGILVLLIISFFYNNLRFLNF